MKPVYLSILFIVLAFTSCKKTTVTPVDFSKITVVDASCVYVGEIDSTDWTYDASWTTQELAFMKFTDTSVVVTDSSTGYVQLSGACSNPNDGLFIIGMNTQRQCKMKLVCVNTDMQILYYNTRKFTGGPIVTSYDFRNNTSFHKNQNYRIYYAFYNATDSLYYKGHGDFRIE
jgi:hypothetical protein